MVEEVIMSEESFAIKCPICGSGELKEAGYTTLPKYDSNSNKADWSKTLVTRIVICKHCGNLFLLAKR